jgi:hypothetical protein
MNNDYYIDMLFPFQICTSYAVCCVMTREATISLAKSRYLCRYRRIKVYPKTFHSTYFYFTIGLD